MHIGRRIHPRLVQLQRDWGVHFHGGVDIIPREQRNEWGKNLHVAMDEFRKRNPGFAMDAQPVTFTTPSDGIPAYLTTIIDPEVIDVLLAPNKAAEILGEAQKGSWTDQTIMFTMLE